ncbi:MAG: M28 family metallopeptidase [Parvularculaceae bacterium]|nr:M20/M25/M40 family metallo-hydrolase [Parvularculaceae bacterium]
MSGRMQFAIAAMLIASIFGAGRAGAANENSSDRIRADVAYLADDARKGREAGEKGYDDAASYVIKRMKEIGVRPPRRGGWRQTIRLRSAVRDIESAQFNLNSPAGAVNLVHLEDYISARSYNKSGYDVDAPLVFAGYGVTAPEEGVDDYADLDVDGKIVVVFTGAPPGMNSEKRAFFSRSEVKLSAAAARGAIGFLAIPTITEIKKNKWPRIVNGARSAGMTFFDPNGRLLIAAPDVAAVATMSEAGARKLFAGEQFDYDTLLAEENQGALAPKGFELLKTAALKGRSILSDARSANVIGVIRGSDRRLARQVVIVTAHLDHLGVSNRAAPDEDAIYNGAIDNASGVAVMLEAARMMQESGVRPKRTVAFIALTAEEKGLLGSQYLTINNPFVGRRAVANVNIDMPVALYPFTDVIAFGAERTTIGASVESAAREMGLTLSPDPMPDENFFVRSDHFSFIKAGVPAVSLRLGFSNGGEKAFREFLRDHYHRPSDDLSLPIDYGALAHFAELNYRILRDLADAESEPAWREGDFFGDLFSAD